MGRGAASGRASPSEVDRRPRPQLRSLRSFCSGVAFIAFITFIALVDKVIFITKIEVGIRQMPFWGQRATVVIIVEVVGLHEKRGVDNRSGRTVDERVEEKKIVLQARTHMRFTLRSPHEIPPLAPSPAYTHRFCGNSKTICPHLTCVSALGAMDCQKSYLNGLLRHI